MKDRRPTAWFAPKRIGYGSSLPIAWQGWLALAIFVAGLISVARIFVGVPRVSAMIVLTLAFAFLCWKKTKGGWRWR